MEDKIKDVLQKLDEMTVDIPKPISLIGTRKALKTTYCMTDEDIDNGMWNGYKVKPCESTWGVMKEDTIWLIGASKNIEE